jgi:hypothetical protein
MPPKQNELMNLASSTQKAPAQPSPAASGVCSKSASETMRFHVELDIRGQVHIHCLQGKKTLASVGFSVAGFGSLQEQGLMRKPRTLVVGAMHDWVELDGELCSFEKGRNEAPRLEQILNDRYIPEDANIGLRKSVAFFQNVASATGFDIQFPCLVGGIMASHRYHLNQEALDLLQDQDHCGLLNQDIIVKLMPPNLVFKRKTPNGGEQYLLPGSASEILLIDTYGLHRTLPLNEPISLTHLSPAELTAIFNHPVINRHVQDLPSPGFVGEPQAKPASANPVSQPGSRFTTPAPATVLPKVETPTGIAHADAPVIPLPNLWLKEILAHSMLRPDWFARLAYSKMATYFGNSSEGRFGPVTCWFICLGEQEQIEDPAFKGIFLTERGSLGFFGEGQMARFSNRVAFVGTRQETIEGIQVNLVAVGLDARQRLVFILSNDYRAKFGVPEVTLTETISRLTKHGAIIQSVAETLASHEVLEVVWTVPAGQSDPNDPEALESIRPQA